MFNSIALVRFSWSSLISILCARMIKMNESILARHGGFSKYWHMEVSESNLLPREEHEAPQTCAVQAWMRWISATFDIYDLARVSICLITRIWDTFFMWSQIYDKICTVMTEIRHNLCKVRPCIKYKTVR